MHIIGGTTLNKQVDSSEIKKNLLTRLNKIEGQIKGIQKMIESEKTCGDVLTQISATRAAINKVGVLLLEKYTKDCIMNTIDSAENFNEKVLDDFLTNIQKFIKNNN
jgi:CsoR family transcriptional regulator, copper-sensing transcriptional repressor